MRHWLSRVPRSAAVLGLVAFLLYAPGSWWGAPTAIAPEMKLSWGTDDETPLGPLAEIHNIIQPKKDRNLGYPLMYSFLAAGAYAPYLGWLKVSGQWNKISGKYPWGFEDPVQVLKELTYIAHLVTVMLGVGLVLCVFFAARTLWDERAGIFAGLAMLSAYPFFYYMRTGNVDGPMVAFIGLATVGYAHTLRHGASTRASVLFGLGAGFAMGSKESCYALLFAMIVLMLLRHLVAAPASSSRTKWPFWKPVFVAAAAGILAFGFGSGLFIEPSRYIAHIQYHQQLGADVSAGKDNMAAFFGDSLEQRFALALAILSHVTDTVTSPLLLLSVLAAGWCAARRDHPGWLVALPSLGFLAAMPIHLPLSQLRYVLPAAPGLMVGVGGAVYLASKHPSTVRWAVTALAVAGITLGMLRGLDLTHAMISDSRYHAGAWLEARLEAGDRIDYFGAAERLPPLPVGTKIDRVVPHMSARIKAPTGPETQAKIRQRWQDDPPRFVITLPDHSSRGRAHHHTMPEQTFADLDGGKLPFSKAAYFKTPPLLPWVKRPRLDYPMVNPPIRVFAPLAKTSTSSN